MINTDEWISTEEEWPSFRHNTAYVKTASLGRHRRVHIL